mgnify:FL=1
MKNKFIKYQNFKKISKEEKLEKQIERWSANLSTELSDKEKKSLAKSQLGSKVGKIFTTPKKQQPIKKTVSPSFRKKAVQPKNLNPKPYQGGSPGLGKGKS